MGVQEEIRKGPWTQQEDFQLVCFVGLFGDRRWDFIAKVSGLKVAGDTQYRYGYREISDFCKEVDFLITHFFFLFFLFFSFLGCFVGLNRTGKSCRLRWVNYLNPGLKRGKMTPQEERVVLELHAKWGNRWSRIAGKLPGRTDNEIKNYWRTLMRKKAQEKKRANNISSPSLTRSSSKSVKSSSSSSNISTVEALPFPDSTTGVESFYDTGGRVVSAPKEKKKSAGDDDDDQKVQEKEEEKEKEKGYYSMDDIWKEISLLEENDMINMELPFYGSGEAGNDNIKNLMSCPPLTTWSSSVWDDRHIDHDQYYCTDSLWKMDIDEEASYNNYKEFFPTTTTTINDQFFSCFGDGENL